MSTVNPSLRSLMTYLDKEGDLPGWSPSPGVVVVGSGKGGIGTSTVATLLALAGARDGRQVLLIDGDEGVGSLNFLLGLTDAGPGLGDLRGGDLEPRDLIQSVAHSLWYLPGGGGGSDSTLATAIGERRALFRRVAGVYQDFDLTVVDGGSHLASVLAACATAPERLLALTTPDRVSMAATHALLKVAGARFPELPLEILVNMGDVVSADESYRMMAQASDRFLGIRPAFAGSVPEDPALREHLETGTPLTMAAPSSSAFDAAETIHGRIAMEQESSEPGFERVLPFPA